jgi:hypothetical protein
MSTQIFKKKIPNEYLFELLDKICVKNKDYYLINIISFKKGMYKNYIKDFFNLCRDYYHISKRKYIDKTITYNSFTTVVRQICNFNKIIYKNEIKYDRSSYDINYYVYFTPLHI